MAEQIYVVDPVHLRSHFYHNQHILGMLAKCNSQQYRRGKDIGYGYFLTTKDQWQGNREITFTMYGDEVTFDLDVVDSFNLDDADDHIILKTAERKIKLLSEYADRDYNVIDFQALPNIRYYLPPASMSSTTITATADTYAAIIADLFDGSGFTVSTGDITFPAVAPVNVFVNGMNILSALEYLLTPIGCTFYSNGTEILCKPVGNVKPTDYVTKEFGNATTTKCTISIPVLQMFGDNQTRRIATYRPEDFDISTGPTTILRHIELYYPFMYELRDEDGNITNGSNIAALKTYLDGRFNTQIDDYTITLNELDPDIDDYSWSFVEYRDYGDHPVTIIHNEPLSPHEVPAAPGISQSVSLFHYRSTAVPDGDTFDAQIYDPDTSEVKNNDGRPLLDVLQRLKAQPNNTTGVGLRIGEKFFALGHHDTVMAFDVDCDSGASGTASVYEYVTGTWQDSGINVTGYNLSTDVIEAGTLVVGVQHFQSNLFVTTGLGAASAASGQLGAIAFTLTENIGATTAGQASYTLNDSYGTLPDVLPTTVRDAQGMFPYARTGAKGYALYDPTDNHLIIIECQQLALLIEAVLDVQGSSPNFYGMKATSDAKIKAGYSALTPSPFNQLPVNLDSGTLTNRLALMGNEDDLVILTFDQSDGSYFPLQVFNRATHVRGQLVGALADTDTVIDIDNIEGLNGYNNDTTLEVYNTHNWDGEDNAYGRAEWNDELQRWEFYQIDCCD